MTPRIAICIAAALLLSACSDQDWSHALTFVGVGGSKTAPAQPRPMAQPAPAPVPSAAAQQASPPNQFCESVASQDAQGNDFDPPTQSRVFVQSYQQCVAVFGNATK